MRSKLIILSFLSTSYFLCEHAMAMEYSGFEGYPFTNAHLKEFRAFACFLEERESEEAKHRDEEGNFLIDYSRMRVCDKSNTAGAPLYSKVIDEIRPLFSMVTPSQLIVINFKGNYLQDEGVEAIVDFVLKNPFLKERLKKLDLSNNRFKASCLPKLKDLVDQCPHLETLSIAINYVSTAEVNQAFQGLPEDKRSIVDFAAY